MLKVVVFSCLACVVACEKQPPTPAAPATASAALPTPKPEPSRVEPPTTPEPEPDRIAAQHVLIAYRGAKGAPKSVRRTKVEARALAEAVLLKARAGEDFSALAGEYSDDPTRTNRGNLGVFPKDQMVPEFSGPAFKLKVDQVSDVVETPFGFHIIRRNQ